MPVLKNFTARAIAPNHMVDDLVAVLIIGGDGIRDGFSRSVAISTKFGRHPS
jgi:hypothetical protein